MKRIYLFFMFVFINASLLASSLIAMGIPGGGKGAPPGAPGGASGGCASMQKMMFPLLIIMVIWYLLLIRPQQKKEKNKQKMITELKKGDKVLTIGGLYGQVVMVKDNRIVIKVSEKTNLEVSKTAISGKVD